MDNGKEIDNANVSLKGFFLSP